MVHHIVLSIAAGYSLSRMENFLGTNRKLVRVMPNLPCKIGAGASGYCLGKNANKNDGKIIEKLLDSIGVVSFLSNEKLLDAVTGLSGCGPAYVALFIEALADGGVKMGLPRNEAYKLAGQTVMGSALMY